MAPRFFSNTRFFILFSFLCLINTTTRIDASAISLRTGIIEFPRTLQRIPPLEIFFEGQKIKVEVEGNKILFTVPMNRRLLRFFFLFVEHPDYLTKSSTDNTPQNTIDYLRVKQGTPYRIFELQSQQDQWFVIERLLPEDGHIPDNTIIVYIPAAYIADVTGGNRLELPHVIIKDNIVDLAGGSEDILQQITDELTIKALDFAALHIPMKESMHLVGNRVLLVPAV
jgi:hypothetical protein